MWQEDLKFRRLFDLKNSTQLIFLGVWDLKNTLFGLNWNFDSDRTFDLNPTFDPNPTFGQNQTFGLNPTFCLNLTFGLNPTFGPNLTFGQNLTFSTELNLWLKSKFEWGFGVLWSELSNPTLFLQNVHRWFLRWTRGPFIFRSEAQLVLCSRYLFMRYFFNCSTITYLHFIYIIIYLYITHSHLK